MRMEKHEAKKVFSHPMETNPQKNHQQKKTSKNMLNEQKLLPSKL